MSLAVSVKSPEGIVLAADSRLTVIAPRPNGPPDTLPLDRGTKVWALGPPLTHVAVSFFGAASAGVRSVGSLLREWTQAQGVHLTVEEVAHGLLSLGPKGLERTSLCVAGYDATGFYGRMFRVDVPGGVTELFPAASWGIALGGKDELARKVVETLKPPLELMPLADTAALAAWLIDLTTASQGYSLGQATVGGRAQAALLEPGRPIKLV